MGFEWREQPRMHAERHCRLCPDAFFFFLIYFLIGGNLLYSVVWVSAIHQRKSAVIIHVSPPSGASLPSLCHPSRAPQSARLASVCYTAAPRQLSV